MDIRLHERNTWVENYVYLARKRLVLCKLYFSTTSWDSGRAEKSSTILDVGQSFVGSPVLLTGIGWVFLSVLHTSSCVPFVYVSLSFQVPSGSRRDRHSLTLLPSVPSNQPPWSAQYDSTLLLGSHSGSLLRAVKKTITRAARTSRFPYKTMQRLRGRLRSGTWLPVVGGGGMEGAEGAEKGSSTCRLRSEKRGTRSSVSAAVRSLRSKTTPCRLGTWMSTGGASGRVGGRGVSGGGGEESRKDRGSRSEPSKRVISPCKFSVLPRYVKRVFGVCVGLRTTHFGDLQISFVYPSRPCSSKRCRWSDNGINFRPTAAWHAAWSNMRMLKIAKSTFLLTTVYFALRASRDRTCTYPKRKSS